MIGQEKLLGYLDNLSNDKFPSFIVLVGGRGCGKTTTTKYISDKLGATMALCGIKVDEIRDIIDTAYTTRDKVVYCIQDADTMRNEAKNAMLKITEEPPKNAYFVMTVQDDSSLLDTIKSRALVLYMDKYSKEELKSYFWSKYNEGGEEVDLICNIATTPYEVDKLVEYGKEFIDYVNLVFENIYVVEPANAFKSGNKLALKNEEDKYDLAIFLRTYLHICSEKLIIKGRGNGKTVLCKCILITIKALDVVNNLGINKQQLYDEWVFNIREVFI